MTGTKVKIACKTSGCRKEWDIDEIIQKADMTDDEALFYEYKVSLNVMHQNGAHTSVCPQCGRFCQRQGSNKAVRCTYCTVKNKSVYDFCWDCQSPWVANHRCENRDQEAVQEILHKAFRKEIEFSPENVVPSKRLCPTCKILIEHDHKRCKQVKCWKCGAEFCYCCLKPCKDGRLDCTAYNQKCTVAPVQKA